MRAIVLFRYARNDTRFVLLVLLILYKQVVQYYQTLSKENQINQPTLDEAFQFVTKDSM